MRNHLRQAAELELSTIPLYLYAAYSIQTQGTYQWAAGMSAFRTIRSVVIEEMLHLCLVRNLLTAIGGGDDFRLYDEAVMPTYPSPMLHRVPTLMLQLEPCTTDLMSNVFMPLELPAKPAAPAQGEQYSTIGQFYDAIVLGFETLSGPELWQDPRPDLQYNRAYWNQDGGGKPLVVTDLPSALGAITTIVEQGEGAAPGDDEVPMNPADPSFGFEELSHYAKFQRIAAGRRRHRPGVAGPDEPAAIGFRRSGRGARRTLRRRLLLRAVHDRRHLLLDQQDGGPRRTECAVRPGADVHRRHGRAAVSDRRPARPTAGTGRTQRGADVRLLPLR